MDPNRPAIPVAILLLLCIPHGVCTTASPNGTTRNYATGSSEMTGTNFPGWAIACIVIACVLPLVCFFICCYHWRRVKRENGQSVPYTCGIVSRPKLASQMEGTVPVFSATTIMSANVKYGSANVKYGLHFDGGDNVDDFGVRRLQLYKPERLGYAFDHDSSRHSILRGTSSSRGRLLERGMSPPQDTVGQLTYAYPHLHVDEAMETSMTTVDEYEDGYNKFGPEPLGYACVYDSIEIEDGDCETTDDEYDDGYNKSGRWVRPKPLNPHWIRHRVTSKNDIPIDRAVILESGLTPMDAGACDAAASSDSEFESLLSQAQTWQEKLIERRSAWRDVCYTATRFIAGLFDEQGGLLRMDHMGIRLLIPPGAIEGSVELIYIYIVAEQKNMPVTEHGQVRVAPTVFCGPHGMKFLERVVLSYEHCANIHSGTILLPMFSSSRPNEEMEFRKLENEGDDVVVFNRQGRFSIMISHFTGFTCVAASTSSDEPLEIFMNLVVYSSSLQQSSTNMVLRLYYIHKTKDALQMVVCEEKSLNGIKRTPFTSWLFKTDSNASSQLQLDGNTWENVNPLIRVAARILRENDYVTKSYMLSKIPDCIDSNICASIHVTQPDQSEYSETLHILAESSDEFAPIFRRTPVLLKQPLRVTLKKLLDPDGLTDWKMFAHKLGLDDMIPKLENDTRRSPTYELLNMWESMRSGDDAADWTSLEGIFKEIGRKDVLTEISRAKLH